MKPPTQVAEKPALSHYLIPTEALGVSKLDNYIKSSKFKCDKREVLTVSNVISYM
jgi:hypothetical protein